MSILHAVRTSLQRIGFDVHRYPQSDPYFATATLLNQHRIDTVIDVGANEGQYARAIRTHGYEGRIVSFEPVAAAHDRLRRNSATDPKWDTFKVALGAVDDEVTINVAGNSQASSSVLPMLERHKRSAPNANYIGSEVVSQRRLDNLVKDGSLQAADRRIYLKIDVQGYEGAVLDGASELLNSEAIVGLQTEVSFVDLYGGGMNWQESFRVFTDNGFSVMAIQPGFTDPTTRQMLQADVLAIRI